MPTAYTVSSLLAAFNAPGTLTSPVVLSDTASRIDANIDALQAVANAGLISAVTLRNGGRPTLALTQAQAVADGGVLALIASPYFLSQRITAAEASGAILQGNFRSFAVVDTAANIVANLAAIEALRDAGQLNIVRMTNAGTPVLSLSAAQVAANVNALAKITSPFTITLTDPGTPAIVLPAADQSTQIFNTVLPAITTPHTVQYSGYERMGPLLSIAIGADRFMGSNNYAVAPANPFGANGGSSAAQLPSGITALDYVSGLGRALGILELAAEAGKLTAVITRDGGSQVLSLSPAEKAANAQALAKFTPNIHYSQIIGAADAALPPVLQIGFLSYTVQDSFANFTANLAAIDSLARGGRLARIRFTEPAADVALSAAQMSQAVFALTFVTEFTPALTLTDGGTPTLTIAADLLSVGAVRTMLNQITSPFALAVTGSISASTAASIVLENNKVLANLTTLRVADFTAAVKSNIASLLTLADAGKLTAIDLLGGGVPALALTSVAIAANAGVLTKISSPFIAGAVPSKIPVSSTASAVGASLAGWETKAEAGTLGSIVLTDSGTPVLAMLAATLARNLAALAAITSPFTITLTDGGTPSIALAPWQITAAMLAVLSHIAADTPYTVSVTGPVSAAGGSLLATTANLTGTITITDFSSTVISSANFAGLETLFQNGHLGSITLLNGNPRIQLTAAQATAGADVLAAIASPCSVSLVGTAAETIATAATLAATGVPNGRFANLTVVDSVATIQAALAGLEPLAAAGTVVSVQASDTASFSLSAAALAANADVFMRLSTTNSIALTDSGTPTLTLQDWQVTSGTPSFLTRITTPVSVVINGPIRASTAANLAANSSAMAKLAPGALAIRDNLLITGFSTYMGALKTLNDAGKLASIDFRNDLPTVSLTASDAAIYQTLASKVISPVTLSFIIGVGGLATATSATLPSGFRSYTVQDSVANVLANLSQIQALGAAGLLGRVNFTDATPRLVTDAATLMANADAFGAQDWNPCPVILTDSGTPSIALPGYQLNWNMRNNVLDPIVGNWNLRITGRVTANLVATIEAEHNGVLAHLSLPVVVADYGYNLALYLDELAAFAKDGKLDSIIVLDGINPATLAPGKAAADADALRKIVADPMLASDLTLTGDGGNNIMAGGPGNDSISGLDGNDSLSGLGGNDMLLGGPGNDTLSGGIGVDSMAGGIGDDIYYVDNAADVVIEAVGEGTDKVFASASYALADGAEVEFLYANAIVGATGLTLAGNAFANAIVGGAGTDTLVGGGGNDTLTGGLGADAMAGGIGDDIYYVDNLGDVVTEAAGEGADKVFASTSYALAAGSEVEFLYANAGASGLTLTGNAFNNTIGGGAGNDVLAGGGGNDSLTGGVGADTMAGGTGDDIYYVENAGDLVLENANEGTDRVYASVSYALATGSAVEFLYANAGAIGLTLTGNGSNNAIVGGAGNDSLVGGGGDDTLTGGPGNDTMAGGIGNDIYYVNSADDIVTEAIGEGTDKVFASTSYALASSSEVEFLCANAGASGLTLTGNAFANALVGGAGNDTLDGGSGADRLTGGAGADLFRFQKDQADGDVIADFVPGSDKLRFVGYSVGSTFLEVGNTKVWRVTDAGSQATQTIIFNNNAHPVAGDITWV